MFILLIFPFQRVYCSLYCDLSLLFCFFFQVLSAVKRLWCFRKQWSSGTAGTTNRHSSSSQGLPSMGDTVTNHSVTNNTTKSNIPMETSCQVSSNYNLMLKIDKLIYFFMFVYKMYQIDQSAIWKFGRIEKKQSSFRCVFCLIF